MAKKYSIDEVLFHFSMSMSSINIQLVLKTLDNINNYLEINLQRKIKRTFRQTFRSMRTFLELQCLVEDLVDFLELSMFINGSLP